MAGPAVDQLLYLLDESFEGANHPGSSVLRNLESVTEHDWLWTPLGGARTIRTITAHVGGAVYLYYDRVFGNHAVFGDPASDWNVPAGNLGVGIEDLQTTGRLPNEPPMADVIAWATECHRAFRNAVAQLNDANLTAERSNHRGDIYPIRWFIGVMVQHYTYHAGEINHIRALHQGNDE